MEFCGPRIPGGDFSKIDGKTTTRLLQLSGSMQIFEFFGAEMTTLFKLVVGRISFTISNNEKIQNFERGSRPHLEISNFSEEFPPPLFGVIEGVL